MIGPRTFRAGCDGGLGMEGLGDQLRGDGTDLGLHLLASCSPDLHRLRPAVTFSRDYEGPAARLSTWLIFALLATWKLESIAAHFRSGAKWKNSRIHQCHCATTPEQRSGKSLH